VTTFRFLHFWILEEIFPERATNADEDANGGARAAVAKELIFAERFFSRCVRVCVCVFANMYTHTFKEMRQIVDVYEHLDLKQVT
jgi:hypothetical protein